jgi:hypothetical protein
VTIERSGDDYILKSTVSGGWSWETTLQWHGSARHTIVGLKLTKAGESDIVLSSGSAQEYVASIKPTAAGGYEWAGGVHGNETEHTFTFTVDGSPTSLNDGESASGGRIVVTKGAYFRHSETGATDHADVTTTYSFTSRGGLEVEHQIDWIGTGDVNTYYRHMLANSWSTCDRGSIVADCANYTLTKSGAGYGLDEFQAAYMWDANGQAGSYMKIPTDDLTGTSLYLTDRADGIMKVYNPEIIPGSWTNGATWGPFSAIYLVQYFGAAEDTLAPLYLGG